jgi:hypothetical protein
MNVTEVRSIWSTKNFKKEVGVNAKKMGKSELIRTIQRKEGNSPCFKGDYASSCGQTDCLWYQDCKK